MSSVIAPVATIDKIEPHPNADRLKLATVLGWQTVIPIDSSWKEGDICVFVPPDCLLPSKWAEHWGVTKFLAKNNRVRRINLRGEASYGFIQQIPDDMSVTIGDNLSDELGLGKYYPPPPKCNGGPNQGKGVRTHPLVQKYTNIESIRNFPFILEVGEEVVITEKIHGSNVKIGLVNGEEVASSMKVQRAKPEHEGESPDELVKANRYWGPWFAPGIKDLIYSIYESCKQPAQILLYGEVYGSGIQKGFMYGLDQDKQGFLSFDILVQGHYLGWEEFHELCTTFGVGTPTILYRGPFIDLAHIKTICDGNTSLGGDHVREGGVIRPVVERRAEKGNRVCFKYRTDRYLTGKFADSQDI